MHLRGKGGLGFRDKGGLGDLDLALGIRDYEDDAVTRRKGKGKWCCFSNRASSECGLGGLGFSVWRLGMRL